MSSVDFRLRERIKELNCLYALSKVAWEAQNDLSMIIAKTLRILPGAMQHQSLAEASITINGETHSSPEFHKCKWFIASPLTLNKKVYGNIEIGYRPAALKRKQSKPTFLPEEKSLLKAVSRELSLLIKRASIEADKEQLQIQLQHSERLAFVGELSAGIAHELNEPLGRVLGFAQLIKKAGNLNDQQSEDIERIIKASLYTREIIKKLMLFSRQMPQQITSLNMNEIVESILYFIDVRFQSRGITITKHLAEKLHDIQADEVQMSQVLVNLITNAVHAMPEGGEITIVTRNKDNHVSVIVKDTGTGMTKEVRQKIFEPFFTTKPVGQGTGLGLSVVQGIIDAHSGKISVSSTPGKGSKFEVLLPRIHR
jgi:two-component system, NtrC family, sensor kinase